MANKSKRVRKLLKAIDNYADALVDLSWVGTYEPEYKMEAAAELDQAKLRVVKVLKRALA